MEPQLQSNRLSGMLARSVLHGLSWRLELNPPLTQKFVLIGAPHTSNLDFVFMLLLVYATGLKLHWVGKHTIFKGPFGWLMRRLGGIPVDRRTNNRFVEQMIQVFDQRQRLILVIAPEGTRGKSQYWRTGFYHIAQGAGVPIVLGYIDYRHKVLGIGPSMLPSGDIDRDFSQIREFYASKTGRRPELQGEILLRPLQESPTS